MKITVIGDLFLKSELSKKYLTEHLSKIDRQLSFNCLSLNWPGIPFQRGEEVDEYVGSEEEVLKVTEQAEVLVVHLAPVTSRVITSCSALRIIGCCRGGPVNVNVSAATQRGIPVINTPGRNALAVAEFTLGLILTQLKNITWGHSELTKGVWRDDFYRYDKAGEILEGKVMGIVGFGSVARLLIPRLKSMGVKILVYDPYVSSIEIENSGGVSCGFEDLLRKSDVVSLHCRLTSETKGMMGERQFSLMKDGAYFVNTARGGLVDYQALYQVLKGKKLAGAALDTFDPEPPPRDGDLLRLKNVTLTPHIAGACKDAAHFSARMVAVDIANFFSGKPLLHCVNPECSGHSPLLR